MSHANEHCARSHRLYRNTDSGVILGVCAGLSDFFEWPLWLIRLAVLGLAWLFPTAVVIAYLVAAMLLPQRPLLYAGDDDERAFWRSHTQRS